MTQNTKPSHVPAQSMDIKQSEIAKLKALFPQCFVEDKLDFDKLRALCDDYIAKDHERYQFEWKGKTDAYRLAAKRSAATLRPCKEESVNFDSTNNLYIEGDNLEVLKQLQKAYFNQIKMIYIDPPYNTGNDFVYTDDFKDPLNKYKEVTQQTTKSNPETMGRYHTNWLNMMLPRLRLAYNLLREDGVIFISIDDNEVTNLRKLCDEVFGEENFIGDIIWNSTKSVTNTALISVSHTYNLVFCKNIEYYITHREKFRLPDIGDGFTNPDNDPRGAWKADPFQVGGWRPNQQYDIVNPKTGKIYKPNPGCSWKNDFNKFQELVKDNRIVFGKTGEGGPQRKRFMSEAQERGRVIKTIWDDIETTTNGTQSLKKLFSDISIFDNPKPVGLIRRMLELGTEKDSIILDFFSGSATTAHAVMELNAQDGGNRRFICVQLPELCGEKSEAYKAGYKNICEIGKERIRRAGKKLLLEQEGKLPLDGAKPLDIGFKVFKLDSSNLVTWDSTPIAHQDVAQLYERMDALAQTIKKDRSDLDLVYEVMLKLGVPLTEPVQKLQVNGKDIWSVGAEHLLLVCLNFQSKSLTQQDIEKLCEQYAPGQIVAAEGAFKDDTALSNAYYTLNNRQVLIKLL